MTFFTTQRPPAVAWLLALVCGIAGAQVPTLTLESLPRPATPPPEVGPIVPSQVLRWRQEAIAFEYGDGVPRDLLRAAELYCRASRYGDPEAQYNLAWMLTHSRGIERDDAQAAHLFAAAAEQGGLANAIAEATVHVVVNEDVRHELLGQCPSTHCALELRPHA